MEAAELANRELRDRARTVAVWSLGIAAYIVLLGAIFQSIEGSAELDRLVEDYPEALRNLFGLGGVDITTGAGYMDTELFNFMLPLLVLVFAIGAGSRTLAGEEEAGRLELLFAYPVGRRDSVLAKGAAVGLEIAVLCAAAWAALAILNPVFDLELELERLAGGILGVWLLGVLHAGLALAVGAVRPSRELAVAVPTVFAVGSYLIGGLHDLAGWLHPFRFVSSFWWIGQSPLTNGVDYAHFAVVGAAAVVALAAGAALLERRDLQTP
jgi:ABC-2 type transport system permease protein